jgi:hypothetical protein
MKLEVAGSSLMVGQARCLLGSGSGYLFNADFTMPGSKEEFAGDEVVMEVVGTHPRVNLMIV